MQFFDTHFSAFQFYGFVAGILCGITSILFFIRNKTTPSIIFLFLAGFIFRFIMAGIDPFLHLWDEQYHALVAKNMLEHPFKPMLYVDPILAYPMENWSKNHIWLHKQPLFLWQIAASFKIFGVNEFALRFPSAIMSALCVLFIYRIGKLISNERIAWCGAFLFAFSNFQLEIATGSMNTDHNDIAFMFYVAASIWAWVEYLQNKKMKWAVLVGLLSGMAILVKWLPGLLVFSGWFVSIIMDKADRKKISSFKHIAFSFLTAILVMLPWQIYKSIMFPEESAIEYKDYGLHFTIPLDGHQGTWTYYFEQATSQYGIILAVLLIPSLFFLWKGICDKVMKIAFFFFIFIVYVFFTLAATKMPLLCLPVAPILFLAWGALLEKVTSINFKLNRMGGIFSYLILFFVGIYFLDVDTMEQKHTGRDPKNEYRNNRSYNCNLAKKSGKLLPSKEYVVFNCKNLNAVMFMFYNENTAYDIYPDKETYKKLKVKKIKMAVFTDEGIPEYLANDPEVFKLNFKMISY